MSQQSHPRSPATLDFFHGTMGASKTAHMVMSVYKARQEGKNVLAMKPYIDTRYGDANTIISRVAQLSIPADVVIKTVHDVYSVNWNNYSQAYCDEIHFLKEDVIQAFRKVVDIYNVSIKCYGLKTNFMRRQFEGSARMIDLATNCNEITSECVACGCKSEFNLRYQNGKPLYNGDEIVLGDETDNFPVQYASVCSHHYNNPTFIIQSGETQ